MIMRPAAVLIAGLLTWQQTPTFRSGIDVVAVDVSVRDRSKVASGLAAADFEVLDNGVRQDIIDVGFDKLPIDVTVALDVSRSVTGDALRRLRDATTQLMRDLGKDDRLRLLTFHARISRVMDFTNDVKAVEQAIRAATAGGGTSIFDTIATAVVSADQVDRRQLLVLFSDGADTTSITEPQALFDVTTRANVAVTAVMPQLMMMTSQNINGQMTVFRLANPDGLTRTRLYARLASDTGGQLVQMRAGDDLSMTFRRILEQFRSSYVLRFVPKGVERGGFHTLQVTVPKRNGLTVRARKGYWGS